MTKHAVAFASIKALDEEQRVIEGWASRPQIDRQGDVLESRGLQPLKGTINLLLDHDHKNAVGVVEQVRASEDGVRFRARLAKISQPGALKQLCDDAWQMVRAGLRSAVSVGFLPLDYEPMGGGGLRFKKWSLLELSLVSVPACEGATIDTIKSLDKTIRVTRRPPHKVVRLTDKEREAVGLPPRGTAVGDALLDAIDRELDRVPNDTKSMGIDPWPGVTMASIAVVARETDAEFRRMQERLAKLERRT